MRFVDDLIGGLSGRRSRVGSERVEPTIMASNEIREYGTLEDLIRESVGSDLTDAGVMVSTDTAARFSAVGSCVRVLSDDLSSLPLVVYRQVGDESQPAKELPLFRLLKSRPNEWQTAAEFRQLAERGLELVGNRNSPRRQWLKAMRDSYAFLEKEFPTLIERWEQERKESKLKVR